MTSMANYYWCLKHKRVETDDDKCDVTNLLGPYGTREEAVRALDTVRQRNDAWEAEDERWSGERD
jgi:hypothetical protein